jgi:putative tryptophan/tyrosine transport system substrate-binding protein
MRRREFLGVLGGGVATWPLTARTQEKERLRRIGALMSLPADDPQTLVRSAAFLQALSERGWAVGRNLQIDFRWATGDADRLRKDANELIALEPEVLLAAATRSLSALQRGTHTIPIVFVQAIDPVGVGNVESLARPGGNTTGFSQFEYGLSGKWLEVLKEIAPNVTRAAVLRDTENPTAGGQLGALQAIAPSLGIDLRPIAARGRATMERALAAFVRDRNGGLVVPGSGSAVSNRKLIIQLAAQLHLPAVYPYRFFVTDGGLISYGPDLIEQYRQAAGYVDRILKGEKPADLPVQAPTKYELVINLKTAKALGLTVPPTLLARADEVIE